MHLGLDPEAPVEFGDGLGSLDVTPKADVRCARQLNAERIRTARLLRQGIDVPAFGNVGSEYDVERLAGGNGPRSATPYERPSYRV